MPRDQIAPRAPRDIPIIFSAPMVLALLREAERPGTGKTQTRRLRFQRISRNGPEGALIYTRWNKVRPGDLLWVRERTLCTGVYTGGRRIDIRYEADGEEVGSVPFPDRLVFKPENGRRLSMGCYREASRLTLVVKEVRFMHLQDISEEDAQAEGVQLPVVEEDGQLRPVVNASSRFSPLNYVEPRRADEPLGAGVKRAWTFRAHFAALWDTLHGAKAWAENPEVVVLTFAVHCCNVDALTPVSGERAA